MAKKKKQISQEKIEKIKPLIDELVQSPHIGNEDVAFLIWCLQGLFPLAVSDEDILEGMTESERYSDGKGDLGNDFYYFNHESNTIHLFQSKYRSKSGNIDVLDIEKLMRVPEKLCDPDFLEDLANEKTREASREFRSCIEDGYSVNMVFVTTLSKTNSVDVTIKSWNDKDIQLHIKGQTIGPIEHSFELCDIDEISERYKSLKDLTELNVQIKYEKIYEFTDSEKFTSYNMLVPAMEIIDLYRKYRSKIFRDNPRGPLGVKGNKDIIDTLKDEIKKSHFHILNNGLSAVCDTCGMIGNNIMDIHDFQIVNGCQTTYSLFKAEQTSINLEKVFVVLKLVANSPKYFRLEISKCSNKQAAIRGWDFMFYDKNHERLQNEFRNMHPPVFYEIRRGERNFSYASKGLKIISVVGLARYMWAFIGKPAEAKDKSKEIPDSVGEKGGPYSNVFYDGVSAFNLKLPHDIYLRVKEELKKIAPGLSESSLAADYLGFSTYHLIGLIGYLVIKILEKKDYKDITPKEAKDMSMSIDYWFPDLFRIANKAIRNVVRIEMKAAEEKKRALQLRALFRKPKYFNEFIDEMNELLGEEETRFDKDKLLGKQELEMKPM